MINKPRIIYKIRTIYTVSNCFIYNGLKNKVLKLNSYVI